MKHTKKLVGLLLALVMILAVASTAFAAGDGSITVDNPKADQTYTAYKIFNVVYNETQTAYSYTIDSGSEWFSTVQTYAKKEGSGLTLTQVNGSTTYNVIADNFSAPEFALTLQANVNGKKGTALTLSAGKASATGLELGYYFVTSTTGALCNLTTTNPTVTIHDKNDIPFDKADDKESVDVGEVVTYTITGKVPDYTGFTAYTYLITDTMSEGLTFKKDVKVTVGGTDVTTDCSIAYDVDNSANKFTVSIPILDQKYTIGAAIKVTYTAVVNEEAVAKIEKNHATLTYSNDPTNSENKATTPAIEQTVYSAKIIINKYVKGDNTKKLADAKFVLYKQMDAAEGETATKKYYKWNETDKKVEWVEAQSDATKKVTDTTGATSFDGLADGTYYLEEIEAPAGYNKLTGPVTIVVNGANATTANLSSLTVTADVENETGTLLPSTGGIGTTIFYVIGGVLVIGAAALLIVKRKKA